MKNLTDYKKQYEGLFTKKNLSGEKALEAVKHDGHALQFVQTQTEEICLEAVKQNGDALRYVRTQTEAICLEAVRQDGYALWYVESRFFFEDAPNEERPLSLKEILKKLKVCKQCKCIFLPAGGRNICEGCEP